MKKKIVPVILLSLFLCSCGNNTQENVGKESQSDVSTLEVTDKMTLDDKVETQETSDEKVNEVQETIENITEVSTENNKPVKEDKSAIDRETWIEQALTEEEARRVMPELYSAEEIISYIAKTGGKAYKGTYEGDTYYLYLTAECDYGGYFTPYVTVVKEKDTSNNPEQFGGRENLYGIVNDETECFLDVDKKYKFSYKGIDADKIVIGEFGNYIESDGASSYSGRSLYFNSGTDILYTFMEENKNWKDGDNANDISISREIQFSLMNPDEAKYWYSQNALAGDWDDFMYYDGYFSDYYVRVEFTDGQNKMDGASHYYMTVLSSVEDLDTFKENKFQIMTQNYSYNEFSKLEDDKFMLEFISDRQAVLTNKQTGTSALVKYNKGYLTEKENMNDSQFYFYDCRMVERHDYRFEGKDYVASDGTFIRFSNRSSMVNSEDITDTGERMVDIFYKGGRSILTAPVQIVDGKTLRIVEEKTNTDLLFTWSDDNLFQVSGTGDYLTDIDGLSFYYEENQLYGY